MVGLIGEANGGWRDLYEFMKYVPKEVALLSMCIGALVLAFILRYVHNFFNEKRKVLISKKSHMIISLIQSMKLKKQFIN